jgi:hypothetical protein
MWNIFLAGTKSEVSSLTKRLSVNRATILFIDFFL